MNTTKTAIIGEYKQQDGWHIAAIFDSPREGREWAARVDEAEGHHHARRIRRVLRTSHAYDIALDIATR